MKREYFEFAGKKFTRRAMQIISKLRDGLVHKEIAELLGVTKGTIDHRVSDIFHKAGYKNSKELVAVAAAHGLERNGIFCGINLFKSGRRKARKKRKSQRRV